MLSLLWKLFESLFANVLNLLGFASRGIAAGSWAAMMMSVAAIRSGGGVAKGSFVAICQSLGATLGRSFPSLLLALLLCACLFLVFTRLGEMTKSAWSTLWELKTTASRSAFS